MISLFDAVLVCDRRTDGHTANSSCACTRICDKVAVLFALWSHVAVTCTTSNSTQLSILSVDKKAVLSQR